MLSNGEETAAEEQLVRGATAPSGKKGARAVTRPFLVGMGYRGLSRATRRCPGRCSGSPRGLQIESSSLPLICGTVMAPVFRKALEKSIHFL